MATLRQSLRYNVARPHICFSRTPALQQRPQVKGLVTRVITTSPKKPNSASRHAAKVKLTNFLSVTTRLPGSGYWCSKYNRVLVHGGRANDLPGVGYTSIRGVFDFSPALFKKKRRSIYGISRPDHITSYVRKKSRRMLAAGKTIPPKNTTPTSATGVREIHHRLRRVVSHETWVN